MFNLDHWAVRFSPSFHFFVLTAHYQDGSSSRMQKASLWRGEWWKTPALWFPSRVQGEAAWHLEQARKQLAADPSTNIKDFLFIAFAQHQSGMGKKQKDEAVLSLVKERHPKEYAVAMEEWKKRLAQRPIVIVCNQSRQRNCLDDVGDFFREFYP